MFNLADKVGLWGYVGGNLIARGGWFCGKIRLRRGVEDEIDRWCGDGGKRLTLFKKLGQQASS